MTSTTWPEAQLGDYIDLLTGLPFKSKQFTDEQTDIRLLRGDNVAQGYLRWEKAKRWDASEYESLEKFHLQKGDVILAMDRPWIAAGLKYAWVRNEDMPSLLVQRVARLRGTNGLLTDYVRCLIGSLAFTDHVHSITTGVNVPHISGRDIKAFRFLMPPPEAQQQIAEIITTYDDLIENNTRRIAVLEEMARRLYEEWFVHLRFPGHEDATFTENDAGRVPEGWKLKPLSTVVSTQYGYTATATEEKLGPRFLRGMDINKNSYISWSNVPFCSIDKKRKDKYLLYKGDLLVIRMADPGKIGFIEEDIEAVFASYLVRLKITDSEVKPLYLFYYLNGNAYQEYITGVSTGTTRKSASAKVITGTILPVPPPALLIEFCHQASAFRDMIRVLVKKNDNLRAQRDLMLPKLVSGEIDVSEMKENMEDVA